jgi:hypothetical protein
MINRLFAHRQKAQFLEHKLWIAERADGKWQVWIEGKRPFHETAVFESQNEAKRSVHRLAHEHLEGKPSCDCPTKLLWQGPAEEDLRRVKRFDYSCEVWSGEQGSSLGQIANLSAEGAFIATSNPPSTGSVLALSFQVGPALKFETQGRVVHQQPNQGIWVQFLDLDPAARQVIAGLADYQEDD